MKPTEQSLHGWGIFTHFFAHEVFRETDRAQPPRVGVFGIALRVLRVSRVFLIAFNRTRLPKLLDRVTLRSDYFVKPTEHSLHRWEFSVSLLRFENF